MPCNKQVDKESVCLAFSENQCAGLCRSEERLEGIYNDCIKDPYNAGACVCVVVRACTHDFMERRAKFSLTILSFSCFVSHVLPCYCYRQEGQAALVGLQRLGGHRQAVTRPALAAAAAAAADRGSLPLGPSRQQHFQHLHLVVTPPVPCLLDLSPFPAAYRP